MFHAIDEGYIKSLLRWVTSFQHYLITQEVYLETPFGTLDLTYINDMFPLFRWHVFIIGLRLEDFMWSSTSTHLLHHIDCTIACLTPAQLVAWLHGYIRRSSEQHRRPRI